MQTTNSRKKALVVENDEQLLASFQAALTHVDFDAQTTWSGRDALSALESGRFDVLLVDSYMPDLHITEFLSRVGRLVSPPTTIVMQSGRPRPSVVRRYEVLGASAVVDKRDRDAILRAVAASSESLEKELKSSSRRAAARSDHYESADR